MILVRCHSAGDSRKIGKSSRRELFGYSTERTGIEKQRTVVAVMQNKNDHPFRVKVIIVDKLLSE